MNNDNKQRGDSRLDGRYLRLWLWLSVAAAVIGAVMLYPIGTVLLNTLFVLIKVAMVSGLLLMLLKKAMTGYKVWAVASACAVVMTVFKWYLVGHGSPLYVLAIVTDVVMPLVAYVLLRKAKRT